MSDNFESGRGFEPVTEPGGESPTPLTDQNVAEPLEHQAEVYPQIGIGRDGHIYYIYESPQQPASDQPA